MDALNSDSLGRRLFRAADPCHAVRDVLLALVLLMALPGCAARAGSPSIPTSKPEEPTQTPRSTRTPISSDTEVGGPSVSGYLFVGQEGNGRPVAGVKLYLAELLTDDRGEIAMGSFDRVGSPQTITTEQGYFAFENVEPGQYGLVLDLIQQSYLLQYPDSEDVLLIRVEASHATDLGELVYPSLPLPSER